MAETWWRSKWTRGPALLIAGIASASLAMWAMRGSGLDGLAILPYVVAGAALALWGYIIFLAESGLSPGVRSVWLGAAGGAMAAGMLRTLIVSSPERTITMFTEAPFIGLLLVVGGPVIAMFESEGRVLLGIGALGGGVIGLAVAWLRRRATPGHA